MRKSNRFQYLDWLRNFFSRFWFLRLIEIVDSIDIDDLPPLFREVISDDSSDQDDDRPGERRHGTLCEWDHSISSDDPIVDEWVDRREIESRYDDRGEDHHEEVVVGFFHAIWVKWGYTNILSFLKQIQEKKCSVYLHYKSFFSSFLIRDRTFEIFSGVSRFSGIVPPISWIVERIFFPTS